MIIARQSTARTVTIGPVLDADGVAVTDCTVGDFKIAKNGGAPASLNGSATLTHRNTGFYSLALTTSDLGTVGQAEIVIDDDTNVCPMKEITIVEEAVYDALYAASATGLLPSNLTQVNGQSTIDGTRTPINLMRAQCADLLGKKNGRYTGTENTRNVADTKNVITRTVDSSTGDVTAVTMDLT